MVYQNMLYVSEYLPILVSKLNLRRICDPDSNNKFEGEQLKGKGISRKVKGNYQLVDVYKIVLGSVCNVIESCHDLMF